MQAASALQTFQNFLTATDLSLDMLTPVQAVDVMIQFYSQVRANECDIDLDTDMLLFQWGVYNWGAGEFFEYDITRQLIYAEIIPPDSSIPDDKETEEEIFGQLSLTFKYEPTSELQAITRGYKWCADLDELPAFIAFIADCEATKHIQNHPIVTRELDFGNAE